MAKRVSRYRVSSTVMSTLVGLVGELIVNTTNNSVHVHDGITANGFELMRVDASNAVLATTSNNGIMTSAMVTQLSAATSGLAAEITNRTTAVSNEATARAAADTTLQNNINTLDTSLDNSRFAANGESVFINVYQNTIPTGWTLNTSFDDRVPIVETTQSQGNDTGGSWTISGLNGTQPNHTHADGTLVGEFTQVGIIDGSAAGAGIFGKNLATVTVTITGATAADGNDAVTINSDGTWRPRYVKVLVISRSTWGT